MMHRKIDLNHFRSWNIYLVPNISWRPSHIFFLFFSLWMKSDDWSSVVYTYIFSCIYHTKQTTNILVWSHNDNERKHLCTVDSLVIGCDSFYLNNKKKKHYIWRFISSYLFIYYYYYIFYCPCFITEKSPSSVRIRISWWPKARHDSLTHS